MDHLKFFIDGEWVDPVEPATIDVINPATEKAFTQISAGSAADVDRAVAAARRAFVDYSQWSVEKRLALLVAGHVRVVIQDPSAMSILVDEEENLTAEVNF